MGVPSLVYISKGLKNNIKTLISPKFKHILTGDGRNAQAAHASKHGRLARGTKLVFKKVSSNMVFQKILNQTTNVKISYSNSGQYPFNL